MAPLAPLLPPPMYLSTLHTNVWVDFSHKASSKKSLISLCWIEGKLPLGQDKQCLTLKLNPQAQYMCWST